MLANSPHTPIWRETSEDIAMTFVAHDFLRFCHGILHVGQRAGHGSLTANGARFEKFVRAHSKGQPRAWLFWARFFAGGGRLVSCFLKNTTKSSSIFSKMRVTDSCFGSLRNKRPGLSGRPHCKGVAIGVARRGVRRSGERTLRVPPSCVVQ